MPILLRLDIKSFEKKLIKKTISTFQEFFQLSSKKFSKLFSLSKIQVQYFPIKRQKYTVLRSPHIDKKSREQFQLTRFHSAIIFQVTNISLFLYFLRFFSFFGIQLKICVKSLSYYPGGK